MSTTVAPRLGVYQWTAGTDEFFREHLNDSFASLETKMAGYLQGPTRPQAGPALRGFVFFNTSGLVLSYCDGTQWWSIAGGESFGSPVSLQIENTSPSNPGGTGNAVARSDHVHGITTFGTPVQVGQSISGGVATSPSRSDHVHSLAASAVNASSKFVAGVVDTSALAALAVGTTKIGTSAAIESKIASSSITAAHINTGAITNSKIQDGAAVGDKIGNLSATDADATHPNILWTGVFATARIPNLDASKFNTGKLDPSVLPAGVPSTQADYPIQPGQILFYAGSSVPEGYLFCNGQVVTDTSHPALHAVLAAAGYPYGGAGTSANVPDLRGKFPLGVSGTNLLGASGGSIDHIHTGPSHTHDLDFPSSNVDSEPTHTHSIPTTNLADGHTHTMPDTSLEVSQGNVGSSASEGLFATGDLSHSHSVSDTSSSVNWSFHAHFFPDVVNSSHSHSISDTTTTYSAGSTWRHDHAISSTSSANSHNHSIGSTGSGGSHDHSVNIAEFASESGGTGNTGTANPPYIALQSIIKT